MKVLKKRLIFCILIIIILATIFIIKNNLPEDRLLRKIYNKDADFEILRYPNNVSFLFRDYEGKIENFSIYRSIYDFVKNEIPKYHSDLKTSNDKQIKNYFEKHKNEIGKILGIDREEEFYNFVKTLKNLETEKLELEKYLINSDVKLEDSDTYYRFVLLVKYKDNDEIGFYMEIPKYNYSTQITPVYYKGNVKKEEMEYTDVILEPVEIDKDIQGRVK